MNTHAILRRSGRRSPEELQEESPEALREHASRALMAVDEIIPIADTVVVRPDPEGAAA